MLIGSDGVASDTSVAMSLDVLSTRNNRVHYGSLPEGVVETDALHVEGSFAYCALLYNSSFLDGVELREVLLQEFVAFLSDLTLKLSELLPIPAVELVHHI